MARRIRRLTVEHLIIVAVAAAIVGLSLAEGGFPPTAFAAGALIVWVVVVLGLATGLLPRSEPRRAAIAAGLCLAGLAGLTTLSMDWASDNGRAFEDAVRALLYLGAFVFCVIAARRGEAGAWLRGLAAGLAIVGGIALVARYEPSWFGNPDADLVADLPAAAGRLTYPIGYWNGVAAMMAAAVVLCGWLGTTALTRWGRALALPAMSTSLLALWMTSSRGGLVMAAAAYTLLVAIGPRRTLLVVNLAVGALGGAVLVAAIEAREQLLVNPVDPAAAGQGDEMLVLTLVVACASFAVRYALDGGISRLSIPPTLGRGLAVAGMVAVLVGVVAADPGERWEDFKRPPEAADLEDGKVGLLRSGGSGRYQFWGVALDAFATAPAGGIGASDYQPYWLENRELAIEATRAHSAIFETLAELGVLGAALLLGFFALPIAAAVSRIRSGRAGPETGVALAVLAVGLLAATVDWTQDLPAVFVPTVVVAALLCGAATLRHDGEPEGPGERLGTARSRRRFAAGVTLLLVAWVSICAAALLLLADNRLEASRDQFAAGDTERAIETIQDAIDVQPWAAEPRTQLALLLDEAGDSEGAREALNEAIRRSERDYQLYLLKVRLDVEAEDYDAARAALERAQELNPRDPEIIRLVKESS